MCTAGVALIEQLAIVQNQTVDASLAKFCDLFPAGVVQTACKALIDTYGAGKIPMCDFWFVSTLE